MNDADLYAGLIRLHVLHHSAREPIYGLAIIEELARHGYRMSPGTLYPLLKGLHARGYLRVRDSREGKRMRRLYTATAQGKRVLEAAKKKVQELFGELFEEDCVQAARRPRGHRPLPGVPGARRPEGLSRTR